MIVLEPCNCPDDWDYPFHSHRCNAYVSCMFPNCGDCDRCLAVQWAYEMARKEKR